MLKVAMIGCGGIGRYHLSHLKEFSDFVSTVGFCDIIPERAEKFAEETGSKAYTDFRVMLDETNPEAVFICIPPYCHGDIENELIDRNIPFFVEKPLSVDLEQAKAIEKRVKEKNLIAAVGFQCRYDSLADHVKDYAKSNPIPFIDCTRFSSIPNTPWWIKRSLSGGQIAEQTIHQLDYIRFVIGEPETVFTMASRGYNTGIEGYDTDDLTVTVVRFKNGTLATVATGCYAKCGDCFDSKVVFSSPDKRGEMKLLSKFEIFGEVQKDNSDSCMLIKGDGGLSAASSKGVVYENNVDAGIICDKTFLEAVINKDGSKIRSPYSDGLKSLAFALACNKSADLNRAVNISDLL
ncbi:MAG: Gfo/Idh/MocA family oxidoreductase [Clostridia bacterium]|nr:Gfo/Idh/MocA family oxidoreductase [Clostridia bacterium]